MTLRILLSFIAYSVTLYTHKHTQTHHIILRVWKSQCTIWRHTHVYLNTPLKSKFGRKQTEKKTLVINQIYKIALPPPMLYNTLLYEESDARFLDIKQRTKKKFSNLINCMNSVSVIVVSVYECLVKGACQCVFVCSCVRQPANISKAKLHHFPTNDLSLFSSFIVLFIQQQPKFVWSLILYMNMDITENRHYFESILPICCVKWTHKTVMIVRLMKLFNISYFHIKKLYALKGGP